MTSQQGRQYKIYCQLTKFPWNFLEYSSIYARSIYIQIQMDFSIEHIWWLLLQEFFPASNARMFLNIQDGGWLVSLVFFVL